jgi:hypothetical protein
VARESALLLNPDAQITAHHADIKVRTRQQYDQIKQF